MRERNRGPRIVTRGLGPIEAVRSAGATPLQVIVHGILVQIADVSFHRRDLNFRSSTVIGLVGAGGIGVELIASLRLMQYREGGAILLIVLVMACLIDGLGGLLRRRFT